MPTTAPPRLREWFIDLNTRQSFRVVAIDEANDAIEVQYFAGELAEFDSDSWFSSEFEPIEAPEDWSGPYGELDEDDLGYSDPDTHPERKKDINISDLLDDY